VGILYGISSASAKGMRNLLGSGGIFPLENFEFLDSLERYFMYSRTRFERKVTTPQKAIFKSPDMLLDQKNIYVKHCTVYANTTAK
jgi:hypothetical protein